MGILDPELFTLTMEQYEAKVFNGDVLVANNAWYDSKRMDASVTEVFGDNCNFYVIKGMPNFYTLMTKNNPVGYGLFAADAINVNCKYPERAVALLDYLRSDEFMRSVKCGLKGIHWDYDETGKPVYIGEYAEAYANNTLDFNDTSSDHYISFPTHKLSVEAKLCEDGYFDRFTSSAEYLSEKVANDAGVQGYLEFYKDSAPEARYVGEVYKAWVDAGLATTTGDFNAKLNFKPAMSDEMNSLQSKLEQYYRDNHTKGIFVDTAEECEAAIEKMITDMKAMGSDKLYQYELDREAESIRIATELGF